MSGSISNESSRKADLIDFNVSNIKLRKQADKKLCPVLVSPASDEFTVKLKIIIRLYQFSNEWRKVDRLILYVVIIYLQLKMIK